RRIQRLSQAQNFELLARREAVRTQHSGEKVPGRGKIGAVERARSPLLLEELDRQARLKPDPVERTNLREEPQRRVVTSHEHMLAVIDHAAGDGVNEGARAPAEVRFLLEDPNAPA